MSKTIDQRSLRQLIRQTLLEDYAGFKELTANISYDIDDELDLAFSKKNVPQARDVKRAYAKEADHEFLNSLVKVHWTYNVENLVGFLMDASPRDEVSTTAYLPGEPLNRRVSFYSLKRGMTAGVELQGRVTLGHYNHDDLFTGSWRDIRRARSRKATIDLPKRARVRLGQKKLVEVYCY